MIPPAFSFPFGRPSPKLSEVDVARLITQITQAAAAAHHEQGWAAVSIGCDGRRRTTMFDGSVCQTEGEVCIATRQDGISACIDAPTQGNGLTSQSIVFKAPACTPATGWYVLDDDGFLYRIPAGLTEPYTYWPPEPMSDYGGFDLVRSGTWGALMCAEELAGVGLSGYGSRGWVQLGVPGGEGTIWIEHYQTYIGGHQTSPPTNYFTSDPTAVNGLGSVTFSEFSAVFDGTAMTRASVATTLDQTSSTGSLTPGTEYGVLLYAYQSSPGVLSVGVIKGPRIVAGTATMPVLTSPSTRIRLAFAVVSYAATGGGAVVSRVYGSTTRMLGTLGSASPGQMTGIILRDSFAPNAGKRFLRTTLPASDTGVTTGEVRLAFGYPLALEMMWGSYSPGDPGIGGGSPWGEMTYPATLTRTPYDTAFVYPERLGIEYSVGHLNLGGPDIDNPGDSEILSTIEVNPETAHDIGANILELPNGEIGLVRPYSIGGTPIVPRRIERYRIRPAPTDTVSFAISQQALGPWGLDPNAWAARRNHQVSAWTPGDTSFTCALGWTHGRGVPCVLWQSSSAQRHPSADPTALYGTLGEPVGLVCPIDFGGTGAPAIQPYTSQGVTVLGPVLVVTYGWTFTLGGVESALSPIAGPVVAQTSPATSTFTLTLTVPLGPSGTTKRSVYRFAFDQDTGNDGYTLVSPWDPRTGERGAVYDRMLSFLGDIDDNVTTELVDTSTTLSYSGTRPPSPFIGPIGAGIVVGGPSNTYLLPPVEL